MGGAMNLALDSLRTRKDVYKQHSVNYTRPWLFLISDGAPTDSDWQAAAQRSRQEEDAKGVLVFPIGVAGADLGVLGQFSSKTPPQKLQGLQFAQFFKWLSVSQQRASTGQSGGTVQLPSTQGWAEAPI